MPKAPAKSTKQEKATNKKTAPAKEATKKPLATKGASKNTEKKAPRRNLNQAVAFLYGGSLVKSSHVYVFAVDNKDVETYVRENLSQYFGNSVNGRSVKCEDAEATLAEVLSQADSQGFRVEADCPILKCSVNNASLLLKEVAGSSTANSFKLGKDEEKTTKKSSKPSKKGKKDGTAESDNEEDAEENEEDAEETDEDEAEDGEDDDEADDAESDEEEEEKPATKKGVQKKGDDKSAKGTAKGKNDDKAKNPKKGK